MALSWNEIKDRAIKFSKEWTDTTNEEAAAKPFLVDFFNVFGIIQKKVASFEHRVKKLDEHDGYIALDKAVDLAYRPQLFASEAKRMEFLFELYEKYTAGLFKTEKTKKTRKKQ